MARLNDQTLVMNNTQYKLSVPHYYCIQSTKYCLRLILKLIIHSPSIYYICVKVDLRDLCS